MEVTGDLNRSILEKLKPDWSGSRKNGRREAVQQEQTTLFRTFAVSTVTATAHHVPRATAHTETGP